MNQHMQCHFWTFGKKGRRNETMDTLGDLRGNLFPYGEPHYKTCAYVKFENGSDLKEKFDMRIKHNAPRDPEDAPCVAAVIMANMDAQEAWAVGLELADELPPGVRLLLIHKDENTFDTLSNDETLKMEKIFNHQNESIVIVTKQTQYKNIIA